MLYTSRILKENEHVIKGYHLCFNLKMENISVFMQEKSFHQPLFYQQNIRQ